MTISYTALLGLAQPVTGTETGQWGTVVNDEITALLEDAVANAASISVTAGNVTLSTTNGSSNQARMSTLIITGTPGTTRNVVAPSQAKIYVVINQSDGAVVIKGAATSGVTIGAGQTAQVAWNGSDFVEIGNYVHGNFVVNGNLSVNGDSTLGNAGADTTTINGQVIAANSNISKTTTLSASAPALAWIKGATYTDTGTAGGTTQALAPFTVFSAPTLSTSNIVTYTNAATVYVAGAPAAAGSATITNPYSLYVAAGDAYFGASVSATTLDLTNLEVTNIKAKDGTASMTLADSTGVVTFSANPVLNAGTANGVPYLSSPGKVLTTGSALTFDGTNLSAGSSSQNLGTSSARWGTVYATAFSDGTDQLVGSSGTVVRIGYGASWAAQSFAIGGSEQMRLTSTGLGIGTSSPGAKLDVLSADGAIVSLISAATGKMRLWGYVDATRGAMLDSTNVAQNAYQPLTFNGSTILLQTGGITRATLDSSGNLGLGVTPSAWGQGTAFEMYQSGYGFWNGSGNPSSIYMLANAYFNGGWKYANASGYASHYYQYNGQHVWSTAGVSTGANNPITFTQAMTLDASGNLVVGTTGTAQGRVHAHATTNAQFVATDATLGATYGGVFRGYGVGAQGGYAELGVLDNGTFTKAIQVQQQATVIAFFTGVNSAGNAERARIDTSGNLGLGVTPSAKLEIYSTNNAFNALQVRYNGSNDAMGFGIGNSNGFPYLGYNTKSQASVDAPVYERSNPAAQLRMDNGSFKFNIAPSGTANTTTITNLVSYTIITSGNQTDFGAANNNVGTVFTANASGTLSSGTVSQNISFTQAMTLDASGRLGVGATNPDSMVEINSATAAHARFRINYNSSALAYFGSYSGIVGSGNATDTMLSSQGVLAFGAGGTTERARITSGGDLLVGTTNAANANAKIRSSSGIEYSNSVLFNVQNPNGKVFTVTGGSNGQSTFVEIEVLTYEGYFKAVYFCANASGSWENDKYNEVTSGTPATVTVAGNNTATITFTVACTTSYTPLMRVAMGNQFVSMA